LRSSPHPAIHHRNRGQTDADAEKKVAFDAAFAKNVGESG